MTIYNKFIASCLIGISALIFIACSSSVKKADIPSTANPQEEIAKLNTDLMTAASANIDVLASSEFQESIKWLNEAKSDQSDKQNQEEILDDLRKSRGYLEKAYQVSENRAQKAPGLFQARQAAMQAGASKYSELKDDLQSVDSDVSAKADDLEKLDTKKISALQERYVTLERQATILTQLGTSQALFNGAKKDGAGKLAPQTFKKVDLSLKNAESVISANVRNPQGYSAAVATAITDAILLNDVMNTIKQNGKDLSESAALKMVAQNTQIKTLNANLSNSAAESVASKTAMNEKNQELAAKLKDKGDDLKSANASVQTQRAMETARSQFTKDEAEAYQQGGNLVIRLKQINFASGRADLPGASLAMLAKVSDVAKSMNASELKVEGHTDSIGSESQNKTISEKRASAVASYFKSNGFNDVKSEGYGFEKPIATNKSKEGRAQNRRVDIIITPDSSATAQ